EVQLRGDAPLLEVPRREIGGLRIALDRRADPRMVQEPEVALEADFIARNEEVWQLLRPPLAGEEGGVVSAEDRISTRHVDEALSDLLVRVEVHLEFDPAVAAHHEGTAGVPETVPPQDGEVAPGGEFQVPEGSVAGETSGGELEREGIRLQATVEEEGGA